MPGLIDELRQLSADAGSAIFQIPPYFAYIAKAFATLEGIGLSVDPQYSILNVCGRAAAPPRCFAILA